MTGSVVDLATQRLDAAARIGPHGCQLEDFVAYMPTHNYIFKPTRELWPAQSVDARVPPVDDGTGNLIPASKWLAKHHAVEQMTWTPGYPMEIKDRLISEGGWIDRPGCTIFNLYRPPNIEPRPGPVDPWLDHLRSIYGDDTEHIIKWLAHRVQRPHEKINHALVLGGSQGIGKDTVLEPVKRAIGPWNFIEVNPKQMLMRFNGFVKSVILRVNEARDLGEFDRFAFYDHMKAYTAAPPDVLRIDEKHLREYSVVNVCGVVITTNYKIGGIYLAPDDRRHFVAWSERIKEEFTPYYWNSLYGWYNNGGTEHVAAYLRDFDLSAFDPKAPPPLSPAFYEIVGASRPPEDAELADVLDALGKPKAVTLETLARKANELGNLDLRIWLCDRRQRRRIPHRLEACGYTSVENPTVKDGHFVVAGRRQVIYARRDLSPNERIEAAEQLVKDTPVAAPTTLMKDLGLATPKPDR
jgi:Family of unknown function (DUF5906)